MPEISPTNNQRKIPAEHAGTDVNFCKTPGCVNFGVPPSRESRVGKRGPDAPPSDGYRLIGTPGRHGSVPSLHCQHCGTTTVLKSNLGVHEELQRITAFLRQINPVACQRDGCANQGKPVRAHPDLYRLHGRTRHGSPRFRCKACDSTVSSPKATARQRASHKNARILTLLMNGMALSRICEAVDVTFSTLYGKIDFLHRQCLAFAAERERRFAEELTVDRLYLCADRQDYIVNWGDRKRRKTIQLTSVGTADLRSGYVFALTPNFDPTLDPETVEEDAAAVGDHDTKPPFRKYARLWLAADYTESVLRARAQETGPARDDLETAELLDDGQALPAQGMQVHAEYTMYGHFAYLRHLLRGVGKVRFFLDPDAGMRTACIAAFHDRIRARQADVFWVAAAKDWIVDDKEKAVRQARQRLKAAMAAHPGLTARQVKAKVIEERLEALLEASPRETGKLQGVWVEHPFPDMSEPEKRVAYMTDWGDYDAAHLSWLYEMASLHAIDTVFMQIRRRLSLLERAIPTARRARRLWHGRAPYDPATIGRMLDIYRVWHNWVHVGDDGLTPAQRLGVAKGPIRMQDVIYFQPFAPEERRRRAPAATVK